MYKLTNNRLKFDDNFNGSLSNFVFPSGLTHLHLGRFFNQDISNIKLPSSLTHLTFSKHYKGDCDQVTKLHNLVYLKFGIYQHIREDIYFNLPPTLKTIVFSDYFNEKIIWLPPSITTLDLPSHYNYKKYPLPTYYLLMFKIARRFDILSYRYICSLLGPKSSDISNRINCNRHNLQKRQLSLFDSLLQ